MIRITSIQDKEIYMRQLLFILLLAVAGASSIYAQHPPPAMPPAWQPEPAPKAEPPLSKAEKEVRKLEREWLDAYEKRDSEAMDRILADEFKLSFSNGQSQTKADILAQLKAGRESGRPATKFSTDEVRSRLEGDTVVLTGRLMQQGARGTMQMTYTDTYIRRDERWQVASSNLKRIQP